MHRPRLDHRRRRALAAAAFLLPSPALATVYNVTGKFINLDTTTYSATDILTTGRTVFTAATNVTLPASLDLLGSPGYVSANFNLSGAVTLAGPLTGTSWLSMSGPGTLVLAGDNTAFTGPITVNGGTLRLASPTALGTGALPTVFVAGAIDLNGFTTPATFNLNGPGQLVNDNTTTPVTLDWQFLPATAPTSGVDLSLGGAGDMTFAADYPTLVGRFFKYGTGTITYSTPTKFTATDQPLIRIYAGTLRLGIESPFAGSSAPVVDVEPGATLDLNGFTSPGLPVYLNAGSLVNNNLATPTTLAAFPTGAGSISLGGAGAIDLTAPLPATRSFTKIGTGTLTLSADNTSYAGTITVAAGTLRLGNPAGAGNAPTSANSYVNLSTGGRFDLNGFAPPRVQVAFNGGALVNDNTSTPVTLSSTSLPSLLTGTGPISLGGAGEILLTRSLATYTVVGPGVVTTNRPVGSTSAVTVNGGTLRLGNAAALLPSSTVTANPGGSFDLNGFPLPAGVAVTLADGAIVNNNTSTPVTLTSFPSLSPGKLNPALGGAGSLALNLYSLPNYSVTLNKVGAGLLTLSPNFVGPGTTNGTAGWKLSGGTLLAETNAQLGGTVTFAGGTLRIAPSSLPDPGSYTFNANISVDPLAGGTIDTQRDTTFTGGLYDVGTLVKTGAGTLTLTKSGFQAGVGFTVNQGKLNVPGYYSSNGLLDWSFLTLNVDDGLTNKGTYRLGGLAGSANLTGYSFILVGPPPGYPARSSTFSGNLTGGGVTLTGTAQLTVTGSLANSTNVNAGTLTLGDGGTTGTLVGSLTVGAAGTLALNRSDDFTLSPGISGSGTLVKRGAGSATVSLVSTSRLKLDVQAGTLRLHPSISTSQIASVTFFAPGASLDLTSDKLVLNYTGPTPFPTILQYLSSRQLFSSAADADPHHLTTLALTEASALLHLAGSQTATWSGQTVDATSLLLQPASFGDANLDGQITPDDYALLDRSYARSMTNAHWTDGDFNYDGSIDQQDYLLIDVTYLQQQGGTPSPTFLSQRESQFGPTYVSSLLASVPEPSLLLSSILYLLPASLLPRRRRTLKIRSTFP